MCYFQQKFRHNGFKRYTCNKNTKALDLAITVTIMFMFMHSADAFIFLSIYIYEKAYACSLGIKPMRFALMML